MHEPKHPVLSLWSAPPGIATGRFPGQLERVDGVASTASLALDRARAAYPGRDVLVCHADACWPHDGWQRLWSAWQALPSATVLSPLDAGLLPPPDDLDAAAMDAACWAWGEHAAFPATCPAAYTSLWRAGVGAVERDAVAQAASFILPCLWIGTSRPVARAAPLEHAAIAGLHDRLRDAKASTIPRLHRDRPVLLHVLHAWDGGIARFARDLAAGDNDHQHLLLVARGDEHFAPFGRYLDLHADLDQPALARWSLADPIADTADTSPEVAAVLAQIIADWGVGAVLVSSVVGHSLDVLRTGLPTTWCAHDAFPFWPLLHDLPAADVDAVSDADLSGRIARQGEDFLFAHPDASHWRRLRQATAAAMLAAQVRLVWPSASARQHLLAMMPALAPLPGAVIAHGAAPLAALGDWQPQPDRPLRVLMPGHLRDGKGEALLRPLLPLLDDGIELIALGCGHAAAARLAGQARLTVHPVYVHAELPAWIAKLQPDIAMLPSTIPETWSYAYSEMCALGIPTLCPAIGALRDRVSSTGFGWLEAPEASAFAARLNALAADRRAVQVMRGQSPPVLPTLAEMASAWRLAMPVPARAPVLAAASPARVTGLGQAHAGRRSLARRQADATRAFDWAHALETELKRARTDLQARDGQLSRVHDQLDEAQVRLIDAQERFIDTEHKLRDAYVIYERDTQDLARQRDTALHMRDVGDAEIARLLASTSWRLTRPLRAGKRLWHSLWVSGKYRLRRLASFLRRAQRSLMTRGLRQSWQQWRARRQAAVSRLPGPDAGRSAIDLAQLQLPRPASPRASVIIPVYNQLAMTLDCLQSLAACADTTTFEVIVVDDASSDDSATRLPGIPGLNYHRNERNLGFIGACNAGAALARGDFLVFLNNDTVVKPGWLDALLATFSDHPDTGLAGSKLVYPDGRLQEAGGIVFSDGSAWNYGRLEDASDPRFNFVREADYCSGAAIALPRALFAELGGFDRHYAPAYYEDTDLAMRVRAHGLKVRYQPASVVVHAEGGTAGTDLNKGMKAYQVDNEKKFLARWRTTLATTHPSPRTASTIDRAANHRQRHRALVIDACTPMPDRDAGSVRMLEMMRVLLDCSCHVTFFPDNHAHDGHYTTDLQRYGIHALWGPWIGDVPTWLAKHGPSFDLIIVSRHYIMGPLLPLLRQYAPQAQLVFDTVDLHFLREEREAEQSGDPMRKLSAKRTRDGELRLVKRSDVTWVVSAFEKALLAELAPESRVDVVSTIHAVYTGTPELAGREDMIFVGGYRHPPNVDAARWLADEIFPRVRARRPAARLHLVGSEAPAEIIALGEREGIVFHGHVPDLDALLDRTRIGLAPLRFGAGVKGKVNHYLSRGLPTVATTCAVEGMHLVNELDALVADDPDTFARAIERLLDDDALWFDLRKAGWANTRRHFSRDAAAAMIAPLLESLPVR